MQPEHPLPRDYFAVLDKSSPVPLYYQLATRLEEAIRTDVLPSGARLENEIALGNRLGLSRPTVRRAIQELVSKGLLVRRRGVGTQVVQSKVTRGVELTSLFDDLSRMGQHPTTKLLEHELVAAGDEIAAHFGISPEERVLRIVRLRSTGEVPLAVMENFLPSPYHDLSASDLEVRGLYQLLRERGVVISVANQQISARGATASEAATLEVSRSSPLLTMSRTAFDSAGRPVEFGRHCYRPELYSFEFTLVER